MFYILHCIFYTNNVIVYNRAGTFPCALLKKLSKNPGSCKTIGDEALSFSSVDFPSFFRGIDSCFLVDPGLANTCLQQSESSGTGSSMGQQCGCPP